MGTDVEVGSTLAQGRFEVLTRLGSNADGAVYEVHDRQEDAYLALKVVSAAGAAEVAALKRDFRAAQHVAHPNLVRLEALFEDGGAWFFTMELVEGEDWLRYVRSGSPSGALDEAKLRGTLAQVVDALAALHTAGAVHRAVKPSSVLVSEDGVVKLLQPEMAARELPVRFDGHRTTAAALVPPEQILSGVPTPAGDLYAVGVMIYEALTGHPPFFDAPSSVVDAKLRGAPTRPSDVAPDAPAELARLCEALLQRDPAARPDAAATLEALGARRPTSFGRMVAAPEYFVGRAFELAALCEAFARVRQGGTVTVMVEGVSGVGKSALVRQFLRGLEGGDTLAFAGKCHEREQAPYDGVDAVVEGLAACLARDDEGWLGGLGVGAIHLLPRLFPELRRVAALRSPPGEPATAGEGSAYELRARVFAGLKEVFTRIAERRPMAVVIDDVQWMKADTRALLTELVAPPRAPRMLLICARRLTEDEASRAAVAPIAPIAGDVRTVRLGPLPTAEASQLAARLSLAPMEQAELATLSEQSGGHPLLLQELVHRRARGAVAVNGSVALDDALWERVALLDDPARNALFAVAVAEVPTPVDVIARAAAVRRRDLAAVMATLGDAHVVTFTGVGYRRCVAPSHDRVRETVALHLDGSSRRDWHERLARAFEKSLERDVERLALHWEGAGDAPRAAALLREAAQRASAALAFDRAADLHRRALALARPDHPGRDGMESELATALVNAGRGAEAARIFLALAHKTGGDAAFGLRVRAADELLCSGHIEEGTSELRAVLADAAVDFPRSRLSAIAMTLWQRLRLMVRGLRFERRSPRDVDPAAATRVDVCWAATRGFGMTNSAVSTPYNAMGARLALNLGDPYRAARALAGYAISAAITGRKGREHTAEVIGVLTALGAQLKDPFIDALTRAAEGFAAYMLEDWPTASDRFAEAVSGFRDRCVGAAFELGTVRNVLGRTLAHRGRLRDLEAQVAPTLRDAVRRNDLFNVANVRTAAGALLALARDDVDLAQREVDETEAVLSRHTFQLQHVYWLVAAGMVDLYRGTAAAGLARFDRHRDALRRSLLETVQSVRVMTHHLVGRLHLAVALGDRDHRPRHVERAARHAARLRSEGLPAAAAFATLIDATLALLRGDDQRGQAKLRDALGRFDGADMILYAAATRDVLGRSVGGEEGARLTGAAVACFEKEGVVSVRRFVRLYAPGVPLPRRA